MFLMEVLAIVHKTYFNSRLEKINEKHFIQYYLDSFPYQQYKFKMVDIELTSIVPLCRYVFKERLSFARQLIMLYNIFEIDLFEPCIRYDSYGKKSIIAPPIVENRNGMNILCDGMHRIYLVKDDLKTVKVLIAENWTLPLPGELNVWKNVSLKSEQMPVEDNFVNFNREGLTGYSKFFNSNYFLDYEDTGESQHEHL